MDLLKNKSIFCIFCVFFLEKNQYHVKNVKKCLVFFGKYTIMIMIELLGEVCGGRKYDSIKCI